MRLCDENKKNAVIKSAIYLINTFGFADTSMSKIAKMAEVSPATIYIYFENKEDMLNKLYLMVKQDFGETFLNGLNPHIDIKDGTRLLFNNLISFFEQCPEKFFFMEQFTNSPFIDKLNKETARGYCKSSIEFFDRAKKEKVYKDISMDMIWALFISPVASLMKRKRAEKESITKKEKEILFQMVWDALSL